MTRKRLASRRGHIIQKTKIGGVRTLYLAIDEEPPNELWLRVKQHGLDAEKVALYDVLAQWFSLMRKHNLPLEEICKAILGVKVEPAGVVDDDENIKMCSSTLDYIARHLLGRYAGRTELFHIKPEENKAL
jgi:ribonucleoside-diphosphate reductase alpha chain